MPCVSDGFTLHAEAAAGCLSERINLIFERRNKPVVSRWIECYKCTRAWPSTSLYREIKRTWKNTLKTNEGRWEEKRNKNFHQRAKESFFCFQLFRIPNRNKEQKEATKDQYEAEFSFFWLEKLLVKVSQWRRRQFLSHHGSFSSLLKTQKLPIVRRYFYFSWMNGIFLPSDVGREKGKEKEAKSPARRME